MHNAYVNFLIHVSLGTINSSTYILDRMQMDIYNYIFYFMTPLAQDMLSAAASEAYTERVFSV